jgi:hypothetical protein
MSKRRKNAGLGFGMMFHGAFASKTDAKKKERQVGGFIQPRNIKGERRYVVMSERKNPIKRKKKPPQENSVAWGKKNPTELLVMGANPGSHEVNAKPGDTITIRVNPTALSRSTDDSRFMLAAAAQLYPGKSLAALTGAELSKVAMLAARLKRENPYFGFGPASPKQRAETRLTLYRRPRGIRAVRQSTGRSVTSALRADVASALVNQGYKASKAKRMAREASGADFSSLFHDALRRNPLCGAMIGGYPCTRKPGHRGPHLPQGATLRPRSRHSWGPRGNPSAEALRESFTGTEVDRITVHREGHMPAGDYALLGKLLALYVKPLAGGQVQVIKPKGTQVVSDESARQLYFVGGDQDISGALGVFGARERSTGLFELGEARRIDYKQRKEHVPDPDVDEWRHEFGEETGERPLVLFDAKHKRLLLEGGAYVVRAEGIVN